MAFQLKTAAFPPNGRIPDIYTCEGEDVPPALAWSGAPAGTESFALIVDDPDAPGTIFCHWAIFDISRRQRAWEMEFRPARERA